MKIIFGVVLLFALAYGQQSRTVTQDLEEAQEELRIGHEFAELFLVQNRGRLSNYLESIELHILDSFLTAYAEIKNIGIETREVMDEYEQSFCKDAIRRRWDLQVTRYGQKMSQCLGLTNGYIIEFTGILNGLHVESRDYTNRIPNVSMGVLSGLDIFTGRDNLQTYINADYRDLFFRAMDWYRTFEEFVDEISIDHDEIIRQFTACFRGLPRYFENESRADLESIRLCYGD